MIKPVKLMAQCCGGAGCSLKGPLVFPPAAAQHIACQGFCTLAEAQAALIHGTLGERQYHGNQSRH